MRVEGEVVVEEEALSHCIDTVHKVFVWATHPDHSLILTLQPIIAILFNLYCFTKTRVGHLR